jgi:peroxiredoxin
MDKKLTFLELPEDLPIPHDDGACNHLLGLSIPKILLRATNNELVNLSELDGCLVVYCYPMTGRPDKNLPDGWNEIPGARGCTPQSCSFRDHYHELQALNTKVFGLSTQSSEYQKEAKTRLHLPFDLLSDLELQFTNALKLPSLFIDNMTLVKRITIIFENGKITKFFYPVFPPDNNIDQVLHWLKTNNK